MSGRVCYGKKKVVKCKRSTEEVNNYLRSQLLGTGEIQIAIDDGELYTSVDNMEKGLKERYEKLCKKSNDILREHIINNLHKVQHHEQPASATEEHVQLIKGKTNARNERQAEKPTTNTNTITK